MKTLAVVMVTGLSVLPLGSVRAQDPPAHHVILVSVDGLRPEYYLDSTWPTPFLQRMASEGVHVDRVKGVFPTLTYPSHTAIVTGALPIHHGVFYNSPFEPGGNTGLWYWAYDSVRVGTIWEAAKGRGLKTASIHWPVTTGAPIDFNVPEAWPIDYSVSRLDFLRSVSTPPGILGELEREATGRLVDYDAGGRTERWRYRFLDVKAVEMAAYLLSVYRPNLLTLHLLSVDDAAHEGLDTPRLAEALASVDALVSYLYDIVGALGLADLTTILVVGDHGFADIDTVLAPNVWLVGEGLRTENRNSDNWRASFHVKGGSAFLHLRDRGDSKALAAVQALIRRQRPEIRSLFDVLSHIQLLELGSDTSAVMALAAKPGSAFIGATESIAVRSTKSATHGHLPDAEGMYTGLVARGPGLRDGGRSEEIRITDIAPLIAYLLGLDMSVPDGRLPADLIERRLPSE